MDASIRAQFQLGNLSAKEKEEILAALRGFNEEDSEIANHQQQPYTPRSRRTRPQRSTQPVSSSGDIERQSVVRSSPQQAKIELLETSPRHNDVAVADVFSSERSRDSSSPLSSVPDDLSDLDEGFSESPSKRRKLVCLKLSSTALQTLGHARSSPSLRREQLNRVFAQVVSDMSRNVSPRDVGDAQLSPSSAMKNLTLGSPSRSSPRSFSAFNSTPRNLGQAFANVAAEMNRHATSRSLMKMFPPHELSIASSTPESVVSNYSTPEFKTPTKTRKPRILRTPSKIQEVTDSTPKPLSREPPPIWAEGRTSLCETLPYFQSYQGGGYTSNGKAYGFMFDKVGHVRDYVSDAVVIARAAGGMAKDDETGEEALKGDQKETAQVKAVKNNIRLQDPVAIILGKGAKQAPAHLPHAYNVLGWFKPTHAWPEKTNGFIYYRYRFEVLDRTQTSWWGPKNQPQTQLGYLELPHYQKCQTCLEDHPQIYQQAWMCLNRECQSFWKLPCGNEPLEETLEFDPRFLNQYTPWHDEEPRENLRPGLFKLNDGQEVKDETSKAAWRGAVCPACGRCNARTEWFAMACENEMCTLGTQPISIRVLSAEQISPEATRSKQSWADVSLITERREFRTGDYDVQVFTLPGTDGGELAHFSASRASNTVKDGPDDMFKELQERDFGLKRRPIRNSVKGGGLCRHFGVNFGMPYKFVAATDSRSFEQAPNAINDARTLLNWAIRQAFPKSAHKDFNESLVLGYMEDQRISYHDDGEHGLGPSIATLSLGSTATMLVRMEEKVYTGLTKGKYNGRTPIPGCLNLEARLRANSTLQSMRDSESLNLSTPSTSSTPLTPSKRMRCSGNTPAVQTFLDSLPASLGLSHATKREAKPLLKLSLNHGDIVVMHGAKIQEHYEHSVSSEGHRRFAITCRDILPFHLRTDELPEYEVRPDVGVFDGREFVRTS